MISIIVFSKKYASSTWCLNELVEIYQCYKELGQMVIPVFYDVDPSDVRKQTGDFGNTFKKTCKRTTEDVKQQLMWMQALKDVASIAGQSSRNWNNDANMIEQISNDVSNKLFTQSEDFGDFVGMDAHIEAMNPMLCLENEEVRMVGIVGPSGIGKSTIARALFSRLSSRFDNRTFVSYKRTIQDDYGMKLAWEKQFLSDILGQKDIKIDSLGVVQRRLKNKKVLIVVDDVDDLKLLETVAGKKGWFGCGSRIIVVTQDMHILRSHEIELIHEVDFPSKDLALAMLCRSAFGKKFPPDGFMELAVEVTELAGNLPLGLNVLGSSLRSRDKVEWVKMLPRLQDGLDGKIEKTLRISYDALDSKDQDLFIHIACLLSGKSIISIENLLKGSANICIGLRILAEKSLIRITSPYETVEMHNLLRALGREIVRAESVYNPGKRRFLVNAKDISDVFKDNTGSDSVLGIICNTSEFSEPLSMDKKSFKRMNNLEFLKFHKGRRLVRKTGEARLYLPEGLVYLPRKLKLLHCNEYPGKYIPSNLIGDYLVELKMENSKLEKMWEGTQPFRSLKKIGMCYSKDLKEIPDLSNAKNLNVLNLNCCTSLVTLPSSIRNLHKLKHLGMNKCTNLKVLPADVSLESLEFLGLRGNSRLRCFPGISRNISYCLWIENLSGLSTLDWDNCPLRCMPSNFLPKHLSHLSMTYNKLEKLWTGVQ
ncbi:hypothetical protein EUTSA_v10019465mg, partial [Eutrema salsugineum]